MKKIQINGKIIDINISKNEDDYILLTDMAEFKSSGAVSLVISHWLSNKNTITYLGICEKLHNPNFNYTEFRAIESRTGINAFLIQNNISQQDRIIQLNQTAISQMSILIKNKDIIQLE